MCEFTELVDADSVLSVSFSLPFLPWFQVINEESMADLSVRQSMELFYPLHGELPPDLAERFSPKRTQPNTANSHSASSASTRQSTLRIEEKAIASIFKDPRVTLEQREQISTAILNGRFEVVTSTLQQLEMKPRTAFRDDEKQRLAQLTVQRHRLPKPNFIEVVTQTAHIPVMSGNEVRSNRIAVQQNMRSPPRTTPHVMERTAPTPKMNIKERQNQLVAEHNRKRMERSKEEARWKTDQAAQFKELEAASALKRIEVKKKLQEVRKTLRAHLMSTRDPQLGTIMRCVDESLIYHFMEKYKGFTMSVQAILTLVGDSLGTTLVNQEVIINDSEVLLEPPGTAETTASNDSHNERADRPAELGATRRSQQLSRRQLPALEFDDSRHNTPSTATAPRSPSSRGASRGRSRGLLDATPTKGSIRGKCHSRGAMSANDREFVSTEARMHPHARSSGRMGSEKEQTGTSDLVRGISPRRYRAERSISPEINPAWGGGFRVVHPRTDGSHSPNRPVAPVDDDNRPASVPIGHTRGHSSSNKRPPKSGSRTMSTSQSLVVFGSENLRLSAASMGFAPGPDNNFVDEIYDDKGDDDNQSLFSHRSAMSNDSYHTSVPSNAIAAMHEQLVEENLLPSMQPEPVLTEEQVRDLGMHKKTFTQIMNEMEKTGSHNSLDTDPALRTQKPHLSQYDTGTPQITDSMPNSPRESSVHSQMMGSLKPSGNVNAIVSNLMSVSAPIRSLFVEPLSATIDVPSPPKHYNSLYGSVYSAADKERFQHLAAMEIERGEQRFGLPSPTVPFHHKLSLSRPYEGSSPEKSTKLAELGKAPLAIKTREGRVDEKNNPIPIAPYRNYQEESHVLNAGVPAGSGLMLWRPRYRVSKEGRYRAGQSRVRIRHSLQEGPVRKPFVSAA